MGYKSPEQWYKISDMMKSLRESLKNKAIDIHRKSTDDNKISVELFSKLLNITSKVISKGDDVVIVDVSLEFGDLDKATYVKNYWLDLNTWQWYEITLEEIKI